VADAFDPYVTPVDYFTLGGLKSPGVARIVGAGSRRKVDVRGAYGISASVAVWLEVAEFKAEIDLAEAQDWIDWKDWKTSALREIRPGKPRPGSDFATDIWHPFLVDFDIKAVIVKSVSQPELVDETGLYRITIEFIEYRKMSVSLSKPTAAKQREVKDATARQIEANTATIEDLSRQLAALDAPKK
jgi:hypothetical protein